MGALQSTFLLCASIVLLVSNVISLGAIVAVLPGFKGLSSVRLLAASADALALLRFDMEVQHARASNNSALPGAVLLGLSLRSMRTLKEMGEGQHVYSSILQQPQAQCAVGHCLRSAAA